MALHKERLCSAHHTVSLPKQEVSFLHVRHCLLRVLCSVPTTCSCPCILVLLQVKAKPWERRLVDESYGSNVPSLLKKASEWEVQYLKALPKPGEQNQFDCTVCMNFTFPSGYLLRLLITSPSPHFPLCRGNSPLFCGQGSTGLPPECCLLLCHCSEVYSP